MWSSLLLTLLATNGLAYPSRIGKVQDRSAPSVTGGNGPAGFVNPPAGARPRFRYWVPDASVDLDVLASDIASVAQAGAGGVEVLGIYQYGFSTLIMADIDWNMYAWGSPAWKAVFQQALQAHADQGLMMDFAIGPAYGQGVPLEPTSPGLSWDLVSFNTSITPGSTFQGTIPGYGSGELIGLTSAAVISTVNYNISAPAGGLMAMITGSSAVVDYPHVNHTLSSSSLSDHTAMVASDGTVNLTFPANGDVEEYRLFATYTFQTYERATLPGPNPQDFIQNGSFVVDHFSSAGAQSTIDFWQQYLLVDEVPDLLKRAGHFAWEDSIEITDNLYWTPSLQTAFKARHGYDITPYIPLLLNGENAALPATFGEPTGPVTMFWLDEEDSGYKYIDDYRTILGELYAQYLGTLRSWSNEKLNLSFSAQVAYNLPVDVLADVPMVDAPELESLGFGRQIDSYKQYVGPANLAGKNIISDEVGAVILGAYSLFLPELLFDIKRAFAAGVNQMVIHGLPYSGNYPNTTWPSYTTFQYLFAEMHGPHQPAWRYYSDVLDLVGRSQYVLQSGVPKRDLAIYLKDTKSVLTTAKYISPDLQFQGYTYEYLSPDNFDLSETVVEDGVLASNGPAYKALLLRATDSITLLGAQKLNEFAQSGLPIIMQGGLPSHVVSSNSSEQLEVSKLVASLPTYSSVHQISVNDSVASTLAAINIEPLTSIVSTTHTFYTYWRHDSEEKMDYVYVYSDMLASQGAITFNSSGTPYFFDAWTGDITAVTNYTTTTDQRTSIFLNLAGNQTAIIGFAEEPIPGVAMPNKACSSSSPSKVANNGSVVLHDMTSSQSLSSWNLTIMEFAPPTGADFFNVSATVYKNHTFQLSSLQPWSSLPGMTNVSGIGYYSTGFTLDASAQGAYIDFGTVVHTIRVQINGKTVPPLDLTHARSDISTYLHPMGQRNDVMVEVATPLLNELRPVWGRLLTLGAPTLVPVAAAQEYGLLDNVIVEAYSTRMC